MAPKFISGVARKSRAPDLKKTNCEPGGGSTYAKRGVHVILDFRKKIHGGVHVRRGADGRTVQGPGLAGVSVRALWNRGD